jgi:hypothetical protein
MTTFESLTLNDDILNRLYYLKQGGDDRIVFRLVDVVIPAENPCSLSANP